VFARMVSAALDQGGDVRSLVVTHPAGWPPDRVAVLTRAATAEPEVPSVVAALGLPAEARVRTVPEPVAVAAAVPAGEAVLVVDAGGGTWDAAVVRDRAVVAAASVPVSVDERIVARVRPSLRAEIITDAAKAALLDSARAGKELLSRHDTAEIVLPDHRAVRLTRAELEVLIAPEVNRLLAAVNVVMADLPVTRVLLVGGASRIPLLGLRLRAVTGRQVVADPEPELAVVRGAMLLAHGAAGDPTP
jgi:molecular chaperone DnaK (HSP70)